jgi:hypothetical protein
MGILLKNGLDTGLCSKYIYLAHDKTSFKEKIAMSEKKSVEKLLQRYERLKASIAALGLVQIGTVSERMDRRSDASGRIRERGPYYQWTFKTAAKTRTVNLTREQARLWSHAIRNHRRLEKTIAEMRNVSLRILRETTTGVPARGSKRGKAA